MSYSFEYIDIILLAMIAGFIFLRLRGILGKKTGYEENVQNTFPQDISETKLKNDLKVDSFDEKEKKLIDIDNEEIEPIKIAKNIPGKKITSIEVLVRVATDNQNQK